MAEELFTLQVSTDVEELLEMAARHTDGDKGRAIELALRSWLEAVRQLDQGNQLHVRIELGDDMVATGQLRVYR